jgi:hypothetical protein
MTAPQGATRSIGIHFTGHDLSRSRLQLAIACGVVRDDPHPYEELARFARGRWRACVLEEADVVVHALPYRNDRETDAVARRARDAGLPCIFFRANDDPTPASPPWGTVYRTSIDRARRNPCEQAVPAIAEDLLAECGGEVVVRKKDERARVGFCGHVGSAGEILFRRALGRVLGGGPRDKARGMRLRARALEVLRTSDRIDTELIARTRIWGGARIRSSAPEEAARREAVRRDFLDNLIGCDYGLALRGKGNYSFRLYEILAMGRIPLFIDTRCVLPFETEIDWRQHCVWVEEADLAWADEIVAQFHADIHPDDFAALQLANRKLWLDYMTPPAIYSRILARALADRQGVRGQRGAR